jgi:hypothetical protein
MMMVRMFLAVNFTNNYHLALVEALDMLRDITFNCVGKSDAFNANRSFDDLKSLSILYLSQNRDLYKTTTIICRKHTTTGLHETIIIHYFSSWYHPM